MREIKFRAWDKLHKRLADVASIDFLSGVAMLDDSEDIWRIGFGDIVMEQYTGLHDKNGKEIFEGDIVKYDLIREIGPNYDPTTLGFIDNDLSIDTELIGKVVVWPSQGVMATSVKVTDPEQFDEKYPVPKRWHINQQFEIVGNIHQNADLLEAEK